MDGACGGFADGVRPCGLPFGDAAIWRLKLVAAATWDRRRRKEKPRSGGEKAHGVCRPGRDTAARRKKLFWHPFCALQKGWKSSGEVFIGLYEAAAVVC